jgi:hypothetical protein
MAVYRPENITGPFVINVRGQIEDQDLSATYTIISSSSDGENDKPFVFKTISDAEGFLGSSLTGEQLDGLDWHITPAKEAADKRDDLNYDAKAKKFV